jgi:peptidoglycan/xylan/chitin deacetylase (PgdA/CDA1 family)
MRIAAVGAVAAALAAALPGAPAGAGETLVAALEAPGAASLRWGAGRCEPRREGAFGWLACTTGGAGEPLLVATRRFSPPLDLRGRFVKVWLRVEPASRLAGLELRLSSDDLGEGFFGIPVPLFADPHFGPLPDGSWTPLSFGFGAARVVGRPARAAIDAIGLFVRDDAGGPVEVAWGGVAALEQAREGLLSLSFDDGLAAHYEVAAPALAQYGWRATAYVMPAQIGGAGYMSAAQLAALRDRFGWEVAAHYDVPLTELPRERLEPTLLGVQRWLSGHGFAAGAAHLAYPLGRHDVARVLPAVRQLFRSARLASGGAETIPPADPHRLRALNVLDSTPPEAIGAAARRAREHGEWLILMFHHLVAQPRAEVEYGVGEFARLLEAVRASGIRVLPVAQAFAAAEGQRESPPAAGR